MTTVNSLQSRFRLSGLAALAAAAIASAACAASPAPVSASQSDSAIRARILELVNAARSRSRRCGSELYPATSALAISPQLNKAAASHARDMARKGYFEHRGADGSQPKDRVLETGYQPRLTGENIALGPESAEEVVAGWLASSGHCANIMDGRFRDIGIAVASGRKRGQIYWVQNFGAPK